MENPNNDSETLIIEERIMKVNGDLHIKKYERGKFLGKGGFAKVYCFTNLETNKVFAGKVIPKANLNRSRSRQKLMVEIKLHKAMRHPNIVKFEHVFEDAENVYIFLELCNHQSMSELLKRRKRLTEFEVQCYLIQMLDAIKYIHSNKIIHRDLKLGNVFISEKMQLKVGDFGLASLLEFDGEKKRTVCGTPNYIAPEILDGQIGHSYGVDIWALGVMLYALLIGKPPFETTDVKLTYKKIQEAEFSFPDGAIISDHARDLINRILVLKPEKRITVDEMLMHPFLSSSGPIPKFMPTSTLACPPTSSYMKQFASTSTSHRIRISTEEDGVDFEDFLKSARSSGLNTARTTTMVLKSPTVLGSPTMDTKIVIPSSPKLSIQTERFRMNSIASSDIFMKSVYQMPKTPMTPGSGMTPNSVRGFFVTEPDELEARGNLKKKEETILPPKKSVLEPTAKPEVKADVRVSKWYDYTSKYGLGYILTNGAIGVSFNDGSKLIVSANEKNFRHIVRSAEKKEIVSTYNFEDYPKDLHKKILVYQKFKEHFQLNKSEKIEEDTTVYVKKWIKTKHAVLFRMSQGVLQADFKDESIIIMGASSKDLTFIEKSGKTHYCPIEKIASCGNKEFIKRFKYTEEVLKHIWNAQADAQTDRSEKGANLKVDQKNFISGKQSGEKPFEIGLTGEVCRQ